MPGSALQRPATKSSSPGEETLSDERGGNLIARAASFRLEAEAMRERASATEEMIIRKQYVELADRWLVLAAGLEAGLLTRLMP